MAEEKSPIPQGLASQARDAMLETTRPLLSRSNYQPASRLLSHAPGACLLQILTGPLRHAWISDCPRQTDPVAESVRTLNAVPPSSRDTQVLDHGDGSNRYLLEYSTWLG